jgi:hypothetical protein
MASGTPARFVSAVLERVESSRAKPTARRGVAAMDLQNGKEYRAIAQARRRLGVTDRREHARLLREGLDVCLGHSTIIVAASPASCWGDRRRQHERAISPLSWTNDGTRPMNLDPARLLLALLDNNATANPAASIRTPKERGT